MFRKPTLRTFLIPAWLLAGLLLVLTACTDRNGSETAAPAEEAEAAARPELPEKQFFDYTLVETSAGVKQWILQSDEMQQFQGRPDVLMSVVTMDFFREGQHYSTLTSDSGTANMTTHDVHVWGDVVVQQDDGDRLETEELFFDNETQLIHNEIFNRMTSEGDVVTGIGLEATPDLEYIKIKERMRGDVSDETSRRASDPPAATESESQ